MKISHRLISSLCDRLGEDWGDLDHQRRSESRNARTIAQRRRILASGLTELRVAISRHGLAKRAIFSSCSQPTTGGSDPFPEEPGLYRLRSETSFNGSKSPSLASHPDQAKPLVFAPRQPLSMFRPRRSIQGELPIVSGAGYTSRVKSLLFWLTRQGPDQIADTVSNAE